MADIKLQMINAALTAAGEDPLTDLTPGSVMANAAIANYDDFVEEELENGAWKFASKVFTPTLITAELDAPLNRQWQLPSAALKVRDVLVDGKSVDAEKWDIEENIIRTCYDSDITARCVFRPAENRWPARFRRIVIQRLEALFLRVTERHSEANSRDAATDIKTVISRHTDAAQKPGRPIAQGSIIDARRGLRRRRFG